MIPGTLRSLSSRAKNRPISYATNTVGMKICAKTMIGGFSDRPGVPVLSDYAYQEALSLVPAKLKGGAGATTTCRELAAAAVVSGIPVGLIDLDAQGGLTRWRSQRTKGLTHAASQPQLLELQADQVAAAAPQLRKRFGLTIIDSPPTVHETIRAVAAAVDLALIPSRPTVDDLDAVGPIARLLRGVVDMGFVLTQVPGGRRSRDGAEALERLAGLAPVLGRTSLRLDYPRPAGAGGTGFESGGAAEEELGELWQAIRDRLGMSEQDDAIPLSQDSEVTA